MQSLYNDSRCRPGASVLQTGTAPAHSLSKKGLRWPQSSFEGRSQNGGFEQSGLPPGCATSSLPLIASCTGYAATTLSALVWLIQGFYRNCFLSARCGIWHGTASSEPDQIAHIDDTIFVAPHAQEDNRSYWGYSALKVASCDARVVEVGYFTKRLPWSSLYVAATRTSEMFGVRGVLIAAFSPTSPSYSIIITHMGCELVSCGTPLNSAFKPLIAERPK